MTAKVSAPTVASWCLFAFGFMVSATAGELTATEIISVGDTGLREAGYKILASPSADRVENELAGFRPKPGTFWPGPYWQAEKTVGYSLRRLTLRVEGPRDDLHMRIDMPICATTTSYARREVMTRGSLWTKKVAVPGGRLFLCEEEGMLTTRYALEAKFPSSAEKLTALLNEIETQRESMYRASRDVLDGIKAEARGLEKKWAERQRRLEEAKRQANLLAYFQSLSPFELNIQTQMLLLNQFGDMTILQMIPLAQSNVAHHLWEEMHPSTLEYLVPGAKKMPLRELVRALMESPMYMSQVNNRVARMCAGELQAEAFGYWVAQSRTIAETMTPAQAARLFK